MGRTHKSYPTLFTFTVSAAVVFAAAMTMVLGLPSPSRLLPRHGYGGDSSEGTGASTAPANTDMPSASPPSNAFADGAVTDTSSKCMAARNRIASWANVTECYGPYLQLFYATPDNVCAGNCLNVTIEAATIVADACAQIESSTGFARAGIYQVWSNAAAARIACEVLPTLNMTTSVVGTTAESNDIISVASTEDSGSKALPSTASSISDTGSVVSASEDAASLSSSVDSASKYLIEAVLNSYLEWKNTVTIAVPGSKSNVSEQALASLRQTQCTEFNREFWKDWVNNPGGQPSLYYWSVPDSADYVAALLRICGEGFLSSLPPGSATSTPTPSSSPSSGDTTVASASAACASPTASASSVAA